MGQQVKRERPAWSMLKGWSVGNQYSSHPANGRDVSVEWRALTSRSLFFRRRRLLADHCEQLAIRNDPAVDRYDPVDLEAEASDVGLQIDRLWIGNLGRLGSRREGSIHIGFDEQFFFA